MSQRNIEVIQTKKTCVMTETCWYKPLINSLNSDPTQTVIKRNYKPGKNTTANLQAVKLPVYSSDTLSYAFISTHMYDLCVLLWWRFAANVENLPYRDYFQSNLPATNNLSLSLAGQCETAMPTRLKITHGRWILTAAWVRQVLGGKT